MKKISSYLAPLFILFFCCGIVYCEEDKFRQPSVRHREAPQPPQSAKPILPPVVPSPSAVSPTPSPHIAAPSLNSVSYMATSRQASGFSQAHIIRNMPSTPVHAPVPTMSISTELPQPTIIGNSTGKIISIGRDKGGSSWIEVRDDISGETLKINLRPGKTPIIKEKTVSNLRELNIGDRVNVIFSRQEDELLANFVSVMAEENSSENFP